MSCAKNIDPLKAYRILLLSVATHAVFSVYFRYYRYYNSYHKYSNYFLAVLLLISSIIFIRKHPVLSVIGILVSALAYFSGGFSNLAIN